MIFRLTWRFLRNHRGVLVVILALQAAQSMIGLLLPSLNADIIDHGVIAANIPYIWQRGGIMLGLALIQGLCLSLSLYLTARLTMAVGRWLRHEMFRSVSDFSPSNIRDYGAATLITRATNDVNQVAELLDMALALMVMAPITAIGGIIMSVRQDAWLSLVVLGVVPTLGAMIGFVGWRLTGMFGRQQKLIDAVSGVLREQLAGVRVVRAFNRDDFETQRFSQANRRLYRQQISIAYTFAIFFPLINLISGTSLVLVVWFGAARISSGGMQIGSLIAFILYISQIIFAVMMASMVFMMLPQARVSAGRIREVLATKPQIAAPAQPQDVPAGRLTFRAEGATLTFGDAQVPVLDDIDLELRPGTTTAIIGATGSGKTLLANLFGRFVDPTAGRVTVSSEAGPTVDLRDLDPGELRQYLAYVPQRAYLFKGTVAANIAAVASSEVTDEIRGRVEQALRIADAWEFISTREGGVDGEVRPGGAGFSGGQRQRLTIARAIYRACFGQAQVLVIDDSFSALDLETDARVRANIRRELKDLTLLIVAQRVATIRDADQILILRDGQVEGRGTHPELLATNATYAEVAATQDQVAPRREVRADA